jgi:hypothetical protein
LKLSLTASHVEDCSDIDSLELAHVVRTIDNAQRVRIAHIEHAVHCPNDAVFLGNVVGQVLHQFLELLIIINSRRFKLQPLDKGIWRLRVAAGQWRSLGIFMDALS